MDRLNHRAALTRSPAASRPKTSQYGALLTAGYASAMATAIAESGRSISESAQSGLELSFAGAVTLAAESPADADLILTAARSGFLAGDQLACPGPGGPGPGDPGPGQGGPP